MSEKIKLPIIVGATASGKSALAMRIAEEIGGEIVSCDSMQIYRRMNIGTAKPTAEEQSRVRHHLIDIVEPWENFSCADYARLADEAVRDIVARGKTPIVCGGTGLYLDALLRGGLAEEADCDEAYRNELDRLAVEKGNDYVHGLLRDLDPESADAIHPNNRKRVIRALEVCRVTGRKKSEIDRENSALDGVYEPLAVGLFYTDRSVLYDRIDRRVDQMLEEGLLDEVRAMDAEGIFDRSKTAAGAIGYKELLGFIRGEVTLAEASDTLKTATRRYAKRHWTWFGAKDYIERIEIDGAPDEKTLEKILEKAKKVFQLS